MRISQTRNTDSVQLRQHMCHTWGTRCASISGTQHLKGQHIFLLTDGKTHDTHQTNQFSAFSLLLHSKQFTVTACRPDSKTKSPHSPVFSGVLPHALSVLWETQHREIKPLYSSDRKGSAKSGVLMFHAEKYCIKSSWKCWGGWSVKYSCWERGSMCMCGMWRSQDGWYAQKIYGIYRH